jgi:hypothetical protein
VLVQPPHISPIQEAFIKDHLVQTGTASQIRLGLRGEHLALLDLDHLRGKGNLGTRVDQPNQLPAIDRDVDLMHPPPLILEPYLAGHLATARIALGGLQPRAIYHPYDLRAKDPSLCQGADSTDKQDLQVSQVELHEVLGQRLRTNRGCPTPALAWGSPPLADAPAHLMGIEADQLHQGLVAQQQDWQGMHAINAKQGPQPIEQDMPHVRHHLTFGGCTPNLRQPVEHSQFLQDAEELIQRSPCIQPVYPIHDLLAVQTSCYARIIPAGNLLIQPFR